jgi:hypothetical protein
MMKEGVLCVVFSVAIFCGCQFESESPDQTHSNEVNRLLLPTTAGNDETCEPLEFKYVIVSSVPQYDGFRDIHVFLNPTSFTENNLRLLFARMRSEFQEKNLTIKVFTNWEQVPLRIPLTCEGTGTSGSDTGASRATDRYSAIYFQRGNEKYFKYLVSAKTDKFKKVKIE